MISTAKKKGMEATSISGRRPSSKLKRFRWIFISLAIIVGAGAVVFHLIPTPIPPSPAVVTIRGTFPTIQAAIDAAENGDVIVIEPGIYRENINFRGKAITLRSTAPDDPEVVAATIIDGGNNGPVVTFRNGETRESVLSGFTAIGGSGTRVRLVWEPGKELYYGYFGGAILVIGSSPTIEKNIITGSMSKCTGGGIAVVAYSSPAIRGNTITWNRARNGSGIAVIHHSSPAITGNTIRGNTAGFSGGGILVRYHSYPVVENNTIRENTAIDGGGILVSNHSSPTITGNTITHNISETEAGGIYVTVYSSPTITGNIIADNKAQGAGGGIVVGFDSSPAITANRITDNTAGAHGGGIFLMVRASPAIKNNTITGNRAESVGGGIALFGYSTSTVTGNTITKNRAERGGANWVSACSALHLNTPDDNVYRDNIPDDIYYE
jgi:parallel beta-helix repeat protein